MPPELLFTSDVTVNLVQKTGGDHMIAAAARVSTTGLAAAELASPGKAGEIAGVINYLMRHRHGTPFEHASMTLFVHAPIFVWREWHRHRVGFSYNEESARYKQLDPVFWVPKPDRKLFPVADFKPARPQFRVGTSEEYGWLVEDMKAGYADAYARYEARLVRGYAREVARAGLPVGIYSSCWVTCNPRSLMNFLSLRTHEEPWDDKTKTGARFVSYPQAEIEEAARVAERIFARGWPLAYTAFCANGRVAP
jgi:thymidylate synthase (FAD)